MNRLQDKVCIVTGAALGIGRACALRLAQEGARVALFDVLDGEGAAVADDLRMQGLEAEYFHVDVSREADVSHAINDVARRLGGMHVW